MSAGVFIRKLEERDWPLLKEIRLKALKSDPGVFGSNYAKEAAMSDEEWRGWLTNKDTASFGVFNADQIIGMTGIAVYWADPSKKSAVLWGSWLSPEFRSKGISKLMYESRLEWARAHPVIEKIIVSHRASNVASKHANQKHDFVFTHKISKEWPDGGVDDDVFYELKIKNI